VTSTAGKSPSRQRGFADRIEASAARQGRRAGGFTYVMLLVAVAVIGILAEGAHELSSQLMRREREAELLFRGMAYRQAIKSYYEAKPVERMLPRTLEDLLNDPRFPDRHHIRALYPDPMAREGEGWSVLRDDAGGITGVASAGLGEPLKQTGFPKGYEKFAGAKKYSEWTFEFLPPPPPKPPTTQQPAKPAPKPK
jgi:type II secretory pathway pseudopilin PulG